MAVSARKIIRFGVFEFDATSGELRSGDTRVRLEPQPARVLALLIDRAGVVVTRNELHEHVWQADTFVDFERGLNYCVAQIRAALGDSASSPRFIETLPRRGYRFVAPVLGADEGDSASQPTVAPEAPADTPTTTIEHPPSQPARRPSSMLLAGLVLGGILGFAAITLYLAKAGTTPAADRVRLAVALFDNETGDPKNDPIVQQFTDLVVTRLAANPDRLGVVGNAAILRERRRFRDVKAIAAALGVQYVVLGQLQPRSRAQSGQAPSPSSTSFRLLVHLIRTDDETHLWANRYELDEATRQSIEAEMPAALDRAIAERVLRR